VFAKRLVMVLLVGVVALSTVTSAADASYKPPPIKHVWVIDLENESFGYTFGSSGRKFAPYLTHALVAKGALLRNYYGIGHDSLDNYVAEISGQSGNYELNEDCGIFAPFIQFGGENFDKWTKYGQLSGEGCVFPSYVNTITGQLTAQGGRGRSHRQHVAAQRQLRHPPQPVHVLRVDHRR
jgi:phosphatidylinositol-3-phosphatase